MADEEVDSKEPPRTEGEADEPAEVQPTAAEEKEAAGGKQDDEQPESEPVGAEEAAEC